MPQVPESAELEVILVGLKRCGNHAVANWLLSLAGSKAFYNDIRTHDPFGRSPVVFQPDSEGHVDLLLCSYEDRSLRLLASPRSYPHARPRYAHPSPKRRVYVMLLRDPFNLFASQLKSAKDYSSYISSLGPTQLYQVYADEIEGRTSYLPDDKLVILFNQWKSDRAHRASIAAQLGLDIETEELDGVSGIGGGSSFDGTDFDGRGSEMDTDARWRQFRDDQRFRSLFANKRIPEFGLRHFQLEPELEAWAAERIASSSRRRELVDSLRIKWAEPVTVALRNAPGVYRGFDLALPTLRRIGLTRLLRRLG